MHFFEGVLGIQIGSHLYIHMHTHRHDWGAVSHASVGVVKVISRNLTDMKVDFPEQSGWQGAIAEMEMVPGVHPRHR